jgi:hypothetical protein
VEEGVTELIHRPIPEQGNLDTNPPAVAPVELTELTASVIESYFHFWQLVVEYLRVELIKPTEHLCHCRCHISIPF